MAGREGIQIGMLLFFCAGLLGASCSAKLCANAEDCRRECECFNEDTQRATQCSVAFECNVVDGMCGADYEQSCKEICQVYAARDACGTRTCEQESDCVREAQCGLINQQTGESLCEYICEVAVACDQSSKVCGAEYTIDDATLCRDLTLCPPPQSCAR